MKQLWMRLKNAILCEVSAYKELLELSKKKKDILVNNDTAKLNDIVMREQELLRKIKQDEKQREDCVSKTALALGLPVQELNFQTIIDFAKYPIKQDLINLRSELEMVISQLARINDINKTLIETHMKYTSFCMEAIASHIKGLNTYSHSGSVNDKKATNHVLLDSTI